MRALSHRSWRIDVLRSLPRPCSSGHRASKRADARKSARASPVRYGLCKSSRSDRTGGMRSEATSESTLTAMALSKSTSIVLWPGQKRVVSGRSPGNRHLSLAVDHLPLMAIHIPLDSECNLADAIIEGRAMPHTSSDLCRAHTFAQISMPPEAAAALFPQLVPWWDRPGPRYQQCAW